MFEDVNAKVITIETGYEPRELQTRIHQNMKRFTVLAIHRRFGKTVCAINELIDEALTCKLPNPRVAYIAPYYKQAKAVAWDYAKQYTEGIPNVKAYESELRIDIPLGKLNGKTNIARIQLFGSDHPDSLRGLYFDCICFDEFGLQPVSIWTEVCRPSLADRKGRALFLGTPCGKNHFFEIYQQAVEKQKQGHPEWLAATYRADETGVVDPDELESARENMPEEEYRQEFLCDWAAAIRGAYYAYEMGKIKDKGHIRNVPQEATLPVFCAFDLGLDDYTAIWFFQCFRNEIRVIRYEEFTNTSLIDILSEISRYGYVFAQLIMPWDINIREYTSGKTRLEITESLGFEVLVAPRLTVADGIGAGRALLSQCYFDQSACERGIDCLENYRKKYDPRTGQFLESPVHDEFSHGADAWRYLCTTWDETMGQQVLNSNTATRMKNIPKVKRSMS